MTSPDEPESLHAHHHDGPHGEETVPRGAVDLIGQIVSANVDSLAFTTDRIIESLEAEVVRLAKTIVEVDQTLSQATVIDRPTEARLRCLDPQINTAYDILERKGFAV